MLATVGKYVEGLENSETATYFASYLLIGAHGLVSKVPQDRVGGTFCSMTNCRN